MSLYRKVYTTFPLLDRVSNKERDELINFLACVVVILNKDYLALKK